ncbi:MAG: DNA polymerase III subunit beta [Planctomycetes bacterium]|nr:DNA polymerase III subunit beta [Planctomycetota bacterium]
MKVLCNRDALRQGLAVANTVIPAKTPKPILSNVCLVATADALELVGTDLDVSLRYRIEDVKVIEPGTAVVSARTAHDFVRDLSGETVELSSQDGSLSITSGSDVGKLVTADADEFPVVARFSDEGATTLQGGTFTTLVSRTAFAAAREQGRYAMHGVLMEIEDGRLQMVATDGRRLALAASPIENGPERFQTKRPVIVPTKGVQLFCRVITDPLGPIKLAVEESQIGIKTQNAEVFARLLDGEFPRYKAVIPTESGNVIEADAGIFERKLRLVANATGDETRAVKLVARKGEMELSAQSAGKGAATAQLEIDFKGKNAEITFNADYVIEGLKTCESGIVRLEFGEKNAPGKFTLGENYTYVVMPITIDT